MVFTLRRVNESSIRGSLSQAEHCFACTRLALCLALVRPSLSYDCPLTKSPRGNRSLSFVRPSEVCIALPNKQFNAYPRLERQSLDCYEATNSCVALCFERCKWEVGVFKPISISPIFVFIFQCPAITVLSNLHLSSGRCFLHNSKNGLFFFVLFVPPFWNISIAFYWAEKCFLDQGWNWALICVTHLKPLESLSKPKKYDPATSSQSTPPSLFILCFIQSRFFIPCGSVRAYCHPCANGRWYSYRPHNVQYTVRFLINHDRVTWRLSRGRERAMMVYVLLCNCINSCLQD